MNLPFFKKKDDIQSPFDRPKESYGAVLALAFIIPAALLYLIYIAMEVWPFGNGSVLVLDLNGQYVYFFEDLRNKILNGGSLLYTWSRSLGGEFMGIFAYYIASPFSFLVALFPKDYITEALLVIFLLKCGSCGFTMALYLSKSRPTNKLNTVIFSTMYAVCSYAVVQAHNTMWIDEMIFLPLLVLGVERLITKRQFALYTASLAFACLTSFYIGYMMCIFTFLYFFYYYAAHDKDYENNFYEEKYHFIKSLLRIALYSAIAIAIAMVIIYPAYTSLQFGKNDFQNPDLTFKQKFDFLDMLVKLYPGSYDTVRPTGLPFIYCGVLTLILLPVYFITKSVKTREKVMTGLLMAAIVFSFNGSTIDIFWHGMQKPNWLNYRYSFMLVFLMVVCAYKAFNDLQNIEYKYILGVTGILGLLILVIQKQDYEWLKDISCVWLSLACLAAYAIALHPINKDYMRHNARSILLIIVCLELFISGVLDEVALDDDVVYSKRTSYRSYIEKYQPVVDIVKEYDEENFGSEFYRMEKNNHRKTNDSMALGFKGISNSTSTLNASVIKLLNKMGYASKSHWTKYLGGTPVADSLLGLKYLIFTSDSDQNLYENIYADEGKNLWAYYNPYALSLLCAAEDNLYEIAELDEYDTPFEFLNDLVTAMLGEDEQIKLFKPIYIDDITTENLETTYTSGHKKYKPVSSAKNKRVLFDFTAVGDNEIFCYFPSTWKREVKMTLNGEDIGTYFANETYRIVDLGKFSDGEQLILAMSLQQDDLYMMSSVDYFYYLDYELFEEVMTRLGEGNMNITHFEDTLIEGNISVGEDRNIVYTSIPYDEGWIVSVDGERAELKKALGSLLSFEIDAGDHDILLEYKPKCFTVGVMVSAAGLVSFAVAAFVSNAVDKKRHKRFVSQGSEIKF